MNLSSYTACLAYALLAVMSGCTTTLSGGPVQSDKTGIRYSLPAPHIFLNPQSDGTVKVEVKYLPDPQNTYSLNLNSYLSTATFVVDLENGMLKQVSLDADSSALPAEAIAAASALQKAKMEAAQAELQAKKTAQDAEKAAMKAAVEAVRAQQEKLARLEAKLAFAEANENTLEAEELRDLRAEIANERVVLSQLEDRLASTSTTPTSAFNDPKAPDTALAEAFGPVLFRVLHDESNGGVKLVAVEDQRRFQTSSSAVPAKNSPVVPEISPVEVIVKETDKNRVIRLTLSTAAEIVGKKLVQPSNGTDAVVDSNDLVLTPDKQDPLKLELKLPETLPKGVYRLDLDLQTGAAGKKGVHVQIDWLAD